MDDLSSAVQVKLSTETTRETNRTGQETVSSVRSIAKFEVFYLGQPLLNASFLLPIASSDIKTADRKATEMALGMLAEHLESFHHAEVREVKLSKSYAGVVVCFVKISYKRKTSVIEIPNIEDLDAGEDAAKKIYQQIIHAAINKLQARES